MSNLTSLTFVDSDIIKEVTKFNDNSTSIMSICSDNEFISLVIDGQEITSGEDFHVLERIKQINKENGYNYL
jgi:hypothetical protein